MAQRLIAAALAALAVGVGSCGGRGQDQDTAPAPTHPLPSAGIAGQEVTVYPLTLIAADGTLGWDSLIGPRRAALDRADSLIGAMLEERSPEVNWVLPPALRRASARAPGMLGDPDKMGTALLRSTDLKLIPDPLRSQMRVLNGVAGGRYAFVPAGLLFVRSPDGRGRAELSLVVADVRTGVIEWRTVAHAPGDDPWTALRDAFKTLTPSLP
jgi:hypothetical protein